MLPAVIIHNLLSVDGRIDFWDGDIGLYYKIAAGLNADATLSGSETILKALEMFDVEAELSSDGESDSAASQGLSQRLVIVDSRGRIDRVHLFRSSPYWSDCTVLCSMTTPAAYRDYLDDYEIDTIVSGTDRVDLRAALEMLYQRYGIRKIRVDSGGMLNGVLLREKLVSEISVLIAPVIVGRESFISLISGWRLDEEQESIKLNLTHCERFAGDHVWLRYEVIK